VQGGTVFGHDGEFGGQPLHFDHMSIAKTIARRFLSDEPPYLGPLYEDAADLSAVVGSQVNTSPFRPFIPYHLVYGPSGKRLDVTGASTTPGTKLQQYDPNDTIAQQFSFEDAGGGHFYIRTHTGNLYLTASMTGAVGPNGEWNPFAVRVIQDVKYPPGSTEPNKYPAAQRWTFSLADQSAVRDASFVITNALMSNVVLQPVGGSTNSGVELEFAAPVLGGGLSPGAKQKWQITSPLINTGTQTRHPG
jgi:hypothetical protein